MSGSKKGRKEFNCGGRGAALERQWKLLCLLTRRWWTVRELAGYMGLAYTHDGAVQRMLHRDIQTLSTIFMVQEIDDKEGRYRSVRYYVNKRDLPFFTQ